MGLLDAILITLNDMMDNLGVLTLYVDRVKNSDDELTNVITSHLLTEFILNRIIEEKCSNSKKILDDHKSYTYSVKLTLIQCMGLLPEDLYKNLNLLNHLRNSYAHNLYPDKKIAKYNSMSLIDGQMSIEIKCENVNDEQIYQQFIHDLCFSTLVFFMAHAIGKLDIDISTKHLPKKKPKLINI